MNDGANVDVVRLAWVLVGETLYHVSTFAQLAVADRPVAHCPVCREPVSLKLGRVLAHHAAHRDGSRCALDTEETALHYNTKQHLAAVFRAARGERPLVVRVRCAHRYGVAGETVLAPGQVPCEAVLDTPLLATWDAVEVEVGLSEIRPDVLLRSDDGPGAIIEVRRTHAVTATKLEHLAELGIPWAEVVASRRLYGALAAWTIEAPLPVVRTHAFAQWFCDSHRGQRHRGRGRTVPGGPWIARVVDRYLPDGHVLRDIAFVDGLVRGRRVSRPTLHHRLDDTPLTELPNGDAAAVHAAAHAAFLGWVRTLRAAGERVDSPMGWAPADSLRGGDAWVAGTTLYPHRYQYDRSAAQWRRRPGVGEHRWLLARPLPDAEQPRARGRKRG